MNQPVATDGAWNADELARGLRGYLSEKESILFAYLFGSRGRNLPRPNSDVDLAVYLKPGFGPFHRVEILTQLTEMLETDAVDLVVLNRAAPTLQARVIRDGLLLVDKAPHTRHAFESLALRSYFDFRIRETAILHRRFQHGG